MPGDLLRTLNAAIDSSEVYTGYKKARIEELRLIDRAKCTLISVLNISEKEAHRTIEKQAMDLRLTKKQVAEHILRTYDNE